MASVVAASELHINESPDALSMCKSFAFLSAPAEDRDVMVWQSDMGEVSCSRPLGMVGQVSSTSSVSTMAPEDENWPSLPRALSSSHSLGSLVSEWETASDLDPDGVLCDEPLACQKSSQLEVRGLSHLTETQVCAPETSEDQKPTICNRSVTFADTHDELFWISAIDVDDEKIHVGLERFVSASGNSDQLSAAATCWTGLLQVFDSDLKMERRLEALTGANTRQNAGSQSKRRLRRLQALKRRS